MKRRLGLLTAIVFCLTILLSGCGNDTIIAEVNGEKISQTQFDKRIKLIRTDYEQQLGELDEEKDKELIKSIEDSAYENLIMQALATQEASKEGVKVEKAEVAKQMDLLKTMFNRGSEDGFKTFLSERGLSEKDLKNELETSLIIEKLQNKLTADTVVSDDEVKQYYEENTAFFEVPGGIHIAHILVKTDEEAQEVMEKIKSGEEFSELAAEYSMDPGSKDKGGDVGVVNESTNFVPEFKAAALKLEPGEISEAVKSMHGYHILKAGEKEEASTLSLADVKVELKAQLLKDKKSREFNDYMQKLKEGADIKDLRDKQE